MKIVLLFVVGAIACSQASLVPASTTLIRQATSIAHPSTFAYSQHVAPLGYSAYSAVAPTIYAQQLFAPAHYASPFFTHGPVVAQQSLYPGLIAQAPALGQYPVAQAPVIGQVPVQGPPQVPDFAPVGSPVIEAADSPLGPPQQPPQQSPVLGGGSAGAAFDDDTVSVEAALR